MKGGENTSVKDGLGWSTVIEVSKFRDENDEIYEFLRNGGSIDEAIRRWGHRYIGTEKHKGNVGLIEGRQEIEDIICGLGAPTKWDSTNAYCGVGDSTTPADENDTGLLGASKLYKAMDGTYPQRSGVTMEFRSTYQSAEGNFAWNEFTVSNTNSDAGKNMNRVVTSKGTKVAGEVWTLSLKITLNPT